MEWLRVGHLRLVEWDGAVERNSTGTTLDNSVGNFASGVKIICFDPEFWSRKGKRA